MWQSHPAKVGEVALPVVGDEASEVPPASRAVGQCLLTGDAGTVPLPVRRVRLGEHSLPMALKNHLNAQTEGGLLCALQKTIAENILTWVNVHKLCFFSWNDYEFKTKMPLVLY